MDNVKNTEKVSKFISNLYNTISSSRFPEIIWSESGNSFIIIDKEKFMKSALRNISKTNEYSAFLRQLYVYGFNKSKSQTTYEEEYAHKYFMRDKNFLLHLVRRETEKNSAIVKSDGRLIPNQLQNLLQYLNTQNYKLENELTILKERVDKQENTINGLVELLTRVFKSKNDLNSMSLVSFSQELDSHLYNGQNNNNTALEFQNQLNTPNALPIESIPKQLDYASKDKNTNNVLYDSDEESFYSADFF